MLKQISLLDAIKKMMETGEDSNVLVLEDAGTWEGARACFLSDIIDQERVICFDAEKKELEEPQQEPEEEPQQTTEEEPVKKPEEEPEEEPTEEKPAAKVDTGKIVALYRAGWSQKDIADEMKVAQATVSYHLKKAGVKK